MQQTASTTIYKMEISDSASYSSPPQTSAKRIAAPHSSVLGGSSDLFEEPVVDVELANVACSGGRVFALRDVCSHAEVMLSQGEVDDGQIERWLE